MLPLPSLENEKCSRQNEARCRDCSCDGQPTNHVRIFFVHFPLMIVGTGLATTICFIYFPVMFDISLLIEWPIFNITYFVKVLFLIYDKLTTCPSYVCTHGTSDRED